MEGIKLNISTHHISDVRHRKQRVSKSDDCCVWMNVVVELSLRISNDGISQLVTIWVKSSDVVEDDSSHTCVGIDGSFISGRCGVIEGRSVEVSLHGNEHCGSGTDRRVGAVVGDEDKGVHLICLVSVEVVDV